MPRTVLILNNPIMKVATTQAGLTAGTAVQCQVTRAEVQSSPNYNTIPATGCAGATQSPGLTSYNLQLDWLQDWNAPGSTSLSKFAQDNDGKSVWFELTPDSTVATNKLVGNAYAAAGSYGGAFGDGSAAVSSVQWPLINAPTVTQPAAMAAGAEAEDAAA